MSLGFHARCGAALLALLAGSAATATTEHPGKPIYDRYCAACHNNAATKAPGSDTLKLMRYRSMFYTLTEGKMRVQASMLTEEQRKQVIEYLVGLDLPEDDWTARMKCGSNRADIDDAEPTVAGFGFNKHNHRHLTSSQTGLRTSDFRNLELAWAIAFPGATTMRSQPAIVGSTLFLPVADNSRMFAIDISGEPCLRWVYENDVPLRSSASFGTQPGGRKVVMFSDVASNVHMVDAVTGARIWKTNVGLFPESITTGTPVLHKDRVYAPISQYEILIGGQHEHECCKSHGGVTALDALTGKKIWTMHTMEDAKPVRDRGDGKFIFGPSGAPIWNSPAIDERRGVLYVGTGEATSEPAAPTTNAILAVGLNDGKIRWSFQATPNDIFISGCTPGAATRSLNCPRPEDTVYLDVDFGASMVLAKRSNGEDLLVAGQKAGTVWALDPNNGRVVWRQQFGDGSAQGGIHWGLAFDGKRIYAPINRAHPIGPDGKQHGPEKPGIHALDVDTGKVLWSHRVAPDCSGPRGQRLKTCEREFGLSAAPTVIDGAVVTGSLDGYLRIFDSSTGELLFKYDTARDYEGINGVQGMGGAIDSASIVAANGMLFLNSGYGMFNQPPGNVFLAFRPARKKD
jgi:polyvinyl alcohol dehydrogenase (cytochrome)